LPGRHESGGRKAFYLSMATSTLRGLILVVLVALGLLGLTKLFPQNTSLGVTPGSSSTSTVRTPGVSPSVSTSPSKSRKPRPKSKVTVLVLNGTSKSGLAAVVRERLQGDGYKTKTPGNYPQKIQTTIIYYQSDSQAEAERLQRQRFPGSQLKPAPATISTDVDLEVILGADQVPA
jgi:LytR cell envelope-related transcriptional attenuator